MLYRATYGYDDEVVALHPSTWANFIEVSTPTLTKPDTYSSDYTDYYDAETPSVGHLVPYNLGINVALDTLEVSSVTFVRKPHPGKGKGKGRK